MKELSDPITMRLPVEVLADIEKVAAGCRRTRSWVMVRAMRFYLDRAGEGGQILAVLRGREQIDSGEFEDIDHVIAELEQSIGQAERGEFSKRTVAEIAEAVIKEGDTQRDISRVKGPAESLLDIGLEPCDLPERQPSRVTREANDDPLGRDTSDLRRLVMEMIEHAELGRDRDAIMAEIAASTKRLGYGIEDGADDFTIADIDAIEGMLRLDAGEGVDGDEVIKKARAIVARKRSARFAIASTLLDGGALRLETEALLEKWSNNEIDDAELIDLARRVTREEDAD